jgi:hypothetical protein
MPRNAAPLLDADRAGREAAGCCAVAAGPRYRKISQIAKTTANAPKATTAILK